MASLRDIRRRIQSVKNTRQITRAMKLVAGAKLKRATEAAVAARPYQQALQRTIERVVRGAGDVEHALLAVPDNKTDVVVVVLSSDRGLCGGFNGQLLRSTQSEIDALVEQGKNVSLICYGKKAVGHFSKRGYNVAARHIDVVPENYASLAADLSAELSARVKANDFERALLAYNKFRSVMSQQPSFEQLLPMDLDVEGGAEAVNYTFEPAGQELLAELLPMALRTRIFQAFLETQAGEQAARMTAMDSATRNASEIIDDLTLEYNRARQASITKELIEIVSGAEAL